jgi:hypothetical protein
MNSLYLFLGVQGVRACLSLLSLGMNAIAIAKYSSESLSGISMESLERVFPLEVRGVISRRFKVGNTAGEYTGCGSSPHFLTFPQPCLHALSTYNRYSSVILTFPQPWLPALSTYNR